MSINSVEIVFFNKKMFHFSFCGLLLLFLLQFKLRIEGYEEVIVDTSYGKLIGLKRSDGVVSFLGVPFAEPPIGSYRFRPSRPKRPWFPNTYRATNFSAECLQSLVFASVTEGISYDEDCLYLNIWYPSNPKSTKQPLPVMFWLYGGGFMHGAASRPEYHGNRLSLRDTVVVSCNYRVGALGFLVSISDGLFGNYGLHDQKLALQWVKDNIQVFGGDPSRITIFGESAGAMSSVLHMLDQSLSGKGQEGKIFDAIIMQSNPMGYQYRSLAVANIIGTTYKEQLDCEDLRCLQSESSDELIHVQDSYKAVPRSIGDFFTWGPTLTDSLYYREVRFLRPGSPLSNVSVYQPIETLKQLQEFDIPIILGTTSHEGAVFIYGGFPTRMVKVVYQTVIFSFFREKALSVLKLYSGFAKKLQRVKNPDYRIVLSQIINDYLFRCPNLLFAKIASSRMLSDKNGVFFYEFALPTKIPNFPSCDGLACHTSELPYVFEHLKIIESDFSWIDSKFLNSSTIGTTWFDRFSGKNLDARKMRLQIDAKVARLMADFWTTFATFHDPNGLPDLNGIAIGTRPYNAPWWPRLYGNLPSQNAINEMQREFKQRRKNIESQTLSSVKIENATTDKNRLYQYLAWHESDKSAYNVNNDEIDSLFSNQEIVHQNIKEENQFLKRMKQLKSEYDILSRMSLSNLHIMKFSEFSGVHIIEDEDCICSTWNKYEYKF